MRASGAVLITGAALAVLLGVAIQAPSLRALIHVGLGDANDAAQTFPHWGIEQVLSDALYCAWASRSDADAVAAGATEQHTPTRLVVHDAPPPLVVVYHTDAAYARGTVNSVTSLLRALDPSDDAWFELDVHYIGSDDERLVLQRTLARRVRALAPWVWLRVFALEASDRTGHAAAPEHLGHGSAAAAAARARLDVLAMYADAAFGDQQALVWMLDADTLVVPPATGPQWSPTRWAEASISRQQPLAAAPMGERAECEFATGSTLVRPANVARDLALLRQLAAQLPLGDHDALNAAYGSRLPSCSSARNGWLDWRMNVFGLGERRRRPRTMEEATAYVDGDSVLQRLVFANESAPAVLQWSGPCKPWDRAAGRGCTGGEHSYSLWNTDAAMRRHFSGSQAPPTVIAGITALSVAAGSASLHAAWVLWKTFIVAV